MRNLDMSDVLKVMWSVCAFKEVPRTGWNKRVRNTITGAIEVRKVKNAESVADHTTGLLMLCVLMANALGLSLELMIQYVLFHDFPETETEDKITVHLRGARLKKALVKKEGDELKAMMKLLLPIQHSHRSTHRVIMAAWTEFTEQSTPEARAVFQLDKLEAVIQSIHYYNRGDIVNPWSFYDHAGKHITIYEIRELYEEIKKLLPTRNAAARRQPKVSKKKGSTKK